MWSEYLGHFAPSSKVDARSEAVRSHSVHKATQMEQISGSLVATLCTRKGWHLDIGPNPWVFLRTFAST